MALETSLDLDLSQARGDAIQFLSQFEARLRQISGRAISLNFNVDNQRDIDNLIEQIRSLRDEAIQISVEIDDVDLPDLEAISVPIQIEPLDDGAIARIGDEFSDARIEIPVTVGEITGADQLPPVPVQAVVDTIDLPVISAVVQVADIETDVDATIPVTAAVEAVDVDIPAIEPVVVDIEADDTGVLDTISGIASAVGGINFSPLVTGFNLVRGAAQDVEADIARAVKAQDQLVSAVANVGASGTVLSQLGGQIRSDVIEQTERAKVGVLDFVEAVIARIPGVGGVFTAVTDGLDQLASSGDRFTGLIDRLEGLRFAPGIGDAAQSIADRVREATTRVVSFTEAVGLLEGLNFNEYTLVSPNLVADIAGATDVTAAYSDVVTQLEADIARVSQQRLSLGEVDADSPRELRNEAEFLELAISNLGRVLEAVQTRFGPVSEAAEQANRSFDQTVQSVGGVNGALDLLNATLTRQEGLAAFGQQIRDAASTGTILETELQALLATAQQLGLTFEAAFSMIVKGASNAGAAIEGVSTETLSAFDLALQAVGGAEGAFQNLQSAVERLRGFDEFSAQVKQAVSDTIIFESEFQNLIQLAAQVGIPFEEAFKRIQRAAAETGSVLDRVIAPVDAPSTRTRFGDQLLEDINELRREAARPIILEIAANLPADLEGQLSSQFLTELQRRFDVVATSSGGIFRDVEALQEILNRLNAGSVPEVTQEIELFSAAGVEAVDVIGQVAETAARFDANIAGIDQSAASITDLTERYSELRQELIALGEATGDEVLTQQALFEEPPTFGPFLSDIEGVQDGLLETNEIAGQLNINFEDTGRLVDALGARVTVVNDLRDGLADGTVSTDEFRAALQRIYDGFDAFERGEINARELANQITSIGATARDTAQGVSEGFADIVPERSFSNLERLKGGLDALASKGSIAIGVIIAVLDIVNRAFNKLNQEIDAATQAQLKLIEALRDTPTEQLSTLGQQIREDIVEANIRAELTWRDYTQAVIAGIPLIGTAINGAVQLIDSISGPDANLANSLDEFRESFSLLTAELQDLPIGEGFVDDTGKILDASDELKASLASINVDSIAGFGTPGELIAAVFASDDPGALLNDAVTDIQRAIDQLEADRPEALGSKEEIAQLDEYNEKIEALRTSQELLVNTFEEQVAASKAEQAVIEASIELFGNYEAAIIAVDGAIADLAGRQELSTLLETIAADGVATQEELDLLAATVERIGGIDLGTTLDDLAGQLFGARKAAEEAQLPLEKAFDLIREESTRRTINEDIEQLAKLVAASGGAFSITADQLDQIVTAAERLGESPPVFFENFLAQVQGFEISNADEIEQQAIDDAEALKDKIQQDVERITSTAAAVDSFIGLDIGVEIDIVEPTEADFNNIFAEIEGQLDEQAQRRGNLAVAAELGIIDAEDVDFISDIFEGNQDVIDDFIQHLIEENRAGVDTLTAQYEELQARVERNIAETNLTAAILEGLNPDEIEAAFAELGIEVPAGIEVDVDFLAAELAEFVNSRSTSLGIEIPVGVVPNADLVAQLIEIEKIQDSIDEAQAALDTLGSGDLALGVELQAQIDGLTAEQDLAKVSLEDIIDTQQTEGLSGAVADGATEGLDRVLTNPFAVKLGGEVEEAVRVGIEEGGLSALETLELAAQGIFVPTPSELIGPTLTPEQLTVTPTVGAPEFDLSTFESQPEVTVDITNAEDVEQLRTDLSSLNDEFVNVTVNVTVQDGPLDDLELRLANLANTLEGIRISIGNISLFGFSFGAAEGAVVWNPGVGVPVTAGEDTRGPEAIVAGYHPIGLTMDRLAAVGVLDQLRAEFSAEEHAQFAKLTAALADAASAPSFGAASTVGSAAFGSRVPPFDSLSAGTTAQVMERAGLDFTGVENRLDGLAALLKSQGHTAPMLQQLIDQLDAIGAGSLLDIADNTRNRRRLSDRGGWNR